MRKTSAIASLLFATLTVACDKKPAAGPPAGFVPPPTEVAIVTVGSANVPVDYEFSAQVVPYRRVEVRPRVEGIIQERPFTEGAIVKTGQLLFRIESAKYESALRAAVSRVDAAKQRVDRYSALLAKHAIAVQEVDVARSDLEAAQSNLTQAKRDFDDTSVRAEMDGRVGRANLEVGARVSGPADLLTTIDRLDPVYVSFRPSAQQVLEWSRSAGSRSLASAGSRLAIHALLPDGTELPRTGKLDFIAPSLDNATGTQEYRALFSNNDLMLVPGQFIRAKVVGFKADDALTVPVRAVQTTLGRQFVYIVAEGDTVKARDVDAGAWSGDQWIIKSGLKSGDRVIVDGIQKVGPGRVVKPVPLADSAKAVPVEKS